MSDKSLYQQVVEAGIEHGSYETDLHVKVTGESRKLIDNYEFKGNVQIFRSNIDGLLWFDVPFAYDPSWASKAKANA